MSSQFSLVALFLGIIGDPSKSGVMTSMGTVLWYIFTGFWVLPIFWISKPINSIWFQACGVCVCVCVCFHPLNVKSALLNQDTLCHLLFHP